MKHNSDKFEAMKSKLSLNLNSIMMKTFSTILALVFIFTVSNSFSQNFQWVRSGGSNTTDFGNGVDVDASGNVYTTGSFTGTATFNPNSVISSGGDDVFLTKYNAAGIVQWVQKGGGISADQGTDAACDASGNIFITGDFYGTASFGSNNLISSGSSDVFIVKYNSSGNVIWAVSAGAGNIERSMSAATDNSGNVYITGVYFNSTTIGSTTLNANGTQSDIFIAKYNSSGVFQWAVGGGGPDPDAAYGLATDLSGNLFVTGKFGKNASFGSVSLTASSVNDSADIFILKYTSSGVIQWGKSAGGLSFDEGRDVSTDVNGDCYITGTFSSSNALFSNTLITPSGGNDMFIARYNAQGNLCWVKKGGGNSSDKGFSIKTDPLGNSYVSGTFNSAAAFGNLNLIASGTDLYVVKYNNFGNAVWVNRADANFNINYMSLSANSAGDVYVTSGYIGTANFGSPPITIISAGNDVDAFTAKISPLANLMTGKVFIDYNNNSIQDFGDIPYPNCLISINSGNSYAATNITGNYFINCGTGTNTVAIPNVPSYYSVTPSSHSSNFGNFGNTAANKDFALFPSVNISDLLITLTNSRNAVPGMDLKIIASIKNIGTNVKTGTVSLIFDNLLTYNSSITNPLPSSVTGNNAVWNYSNFLPNETRNFELGMNVPVNAIVGTSLNHSATITPVAGDINPADNVTTLAHLVLASYDPNKKEVVPAGPFFQQNVTNQDWLTYTVHFQNTGSDTARNIVLVDTISTKLVVPTIEMLASSHSYTSIIKNSGIVEWNFSNIMLPDSTTNEKLSHGFIKYRIRPKSNLVNGDIIKNWADIFFDYNSPVRTDTAQTPVIILPTLISVTYSLEVWLNMPHEMSVYLCSSTSPYQIMDSAKKIVSSTIVGGGYFDNFEFLNANTSSEYYIVMKHKNSLETWSSGLVTFEHLPAFYDFSSSVSQAYGSNMKAVNGLAAFYSGDIGNDGTIDADDVISVYNDAINFESGSPNTDLNGDGIVDAADLVTVYNNSRNFVSVSKP